MFAHAGTVGALTAAAKLAGAAKVIATARFLGAGDALDAFFIAFLLPSFVSDVVSGSFAPALVPRLVHAAASEGVEAARRLARAALSIALAVMLAGAATLAVCGRWLLPLAGSSFSQPKLRLAAVLFFGLLVWLPMSALISTWRAVLNANHRFALAALAPIASPALCIALLAAFTRTLGVTVLCVGTVGGVALECAMLAIGVSRLGYPILPSWPRWQDPEVKRLGRQYFPLAAGAMISSACGLVDQSMAGRLGSGQVSALVYGNKLALTLLQIVAFSLGTAVLPQFSRLAAARQWTRLRRTALVYCGAVTMIVVPVTIALIVASAMLVRIFFQHGAFSEDAARLVTQVQRCALVQAPFAVLLAITTRLSSALSANALLVRAGAVALASDVVFDLILSRWFGVAGIALATAAVQAASLLTLVLLLRRREPRLFAAEAD